MRKLILILALTAVPFGIWTAGCQNDARQAAFPGTPEMNALSKNTGKNARDAESAANAVPVIHPKAIDRNILDLPESGALARIQAANDRASQYAAEKAAHGLFTLPGEKNYVSSALSAPAHRESDAQDEKQVMPASAIPAPSAKEFWSRPIAAHAGETGGIAPADISAMAPPALPSLRATRENAPGKRSSVRRRAEITERAPVDPGIAKVSEVEGSGFVASPWAFTAFPPIPAGARIVSSVGLEGFEPLPEPIPLEQYRSMTRSEMAILPVKMEKPVEKRKTAILLPPPPAAISAPEKSGPKVSPVSANASAPAAGTALAFGLAPAAPPMLAPLEKPAKPAPKFAELEPTPATSSMKSAAPSSSGSAPEALPTPEETAAKADPVAFSPEKMDEAFEALGKSDFFKTDFWSPSAKTLAPATATALGMIPELTDPGEAALAVKPPEAKQPTTKPPFAEPEKIVLRPVRKIRAIPELEQIDSGTEVPPLKF